MDLNTFMFLTITATDGYFNSDELSSEGIFSISYIYLLPCNKVFNPLLKLG